MIELDDNNEYRIYIVWKLVGDRPILVAIDTSKNRATQHVLAVREEAKMLGNPISETYVEESKLNHFYGESVTDFKSFKLLSFF